MADQMSCLGFRFADEQAVQSYFDTNWSKKAVVDLARGLYLRISTEPGIECWLSVDPDTQEVLDWDIHYAAAAAQGCAFDCDLSADAAGQSGYIRVLLKPGTDDELPLTAACPMLARWADREQGSPGLISPAFYALELLPDAAASESLLLPDPDTNCAVVTGHVVSAERLRNAYSGQDFWHLVLACRGMELDLLCEEAAFTQVPRTGALITASALVTAMAEEGVTA